MVLPLAFAHVVARAVLLVRVVADVSVGFGAHHLVGCGGKEGRGLEGGGGEAKTAMQGERRLQRSYFYSIMAIQKTLCISMDS